METTRATTRKSEPPAKVIRAERIELVDSLGRVRVRMGQDKPSRSKFFKHFPPEDNFNIELLSPDGKEAVLLRATTHGWGMVRVGGFVGGRMIEGNPPDYAERAKEEIDAMLAAEKKADVTA